MSIVLSLYRGLIERRPTMHEIASATAERHDMNLEVLRGYTGRQKLAQARQEAMWLIHATGRFSNQQIGNYFSGRDHSTVTKGRYAHAARITRDARPLGIEAA